MTDNFIIGKELSIKEDRMSSISANRWLHVIFLGTLWGVSECILGLYLRRCASLTSGSLMTAVALFFLTAGWNIGRSRLAIPVMVIIASVFKMTDALLLSLPVQHGAVANPVFAFLMEGFSLWMIITFFSPAWRERLVGQAVAGAFGALLAVNLFPLVGHVTGIPACVVPGTQFPLSLYYAPLAVSLSALSFPLGILAGKALERATEKSWLKSMSPSLARLAATTLFLIGIIILVVSRELPLLK